jgi:hypothetical protein
LRKERHASLRALFRSQELLHERHAHVVFDITWGEHSPELVQKANRTLNNYWDGVRRLPFSNDAIADGLATLVICIQEYFKAEREVPHVFEELFGETVLVEFADFNGLNQTTVISKHGLINVIDLTILDKLTPYVKRCVSENPPDIFSFVLNCEVTCDLQRLATMMAQEMIPAQLADHLIQGLKDRDWDPIFEASSFDPTHLGYLSTSRFRFDFPFAVDPQPEDTFTFFKI